MAMANSSFTFWNFLEFLNPWIRRARTWRADCIPVHLEGRGSRILTEKGEVFQAGGPGPEAGEWGQQRPQAASGRGSYFDALRAQWDYDSDWSDKRDGDKNEVLVLILSKPLVPSENLEAQRSQAAQASRGRTCLPEAHTLCPPPCHLGGVARPLSFPFLNLGTQLRGVS